MKFAVQILNDVCGLSLYEDRSAELYNFSGILLII